MATNLYWVNIHARGAGSTPEEAYTEASKRLAKAAHDFKNGNTTIDPGVQVAYNDPGGGGGGPCAPEYIDIAVNVTAAGLPEAQNRDDD